MGSFQAKVTTGQNYFVNAPHGFIGYTFSGITWYAIINLINNNNNNNNALRWYNSSIPSGVIFDYDFITVSLHELTHMLGFISLTGTYNNLTSYTSLCW